VLAPGRARGGEQRGGDQGVPHPGSVTVMVP
jgi:hypothetical protein